MRRNGVGYAKMTKRTSRAKRILAASVTIALAAATLVAFTPSGAAHGGNHGTIKVHDEVDAEPDRRNEPHVSCDFWIEGFNMHDSMGSLVFEAWPPTGDKEEVTPAGDTLAWVGTPEEDQDGYHFLKGPYALPPGHYRVEAFSNDGHPGGHDHFSKAKMFWVDECEVPPPEGCPEVGLEATANEDGSITVDVDVEGNFTLMRSEGSGGFGSVGDFRGDTRYVDTDTTPGVTYTYKVVIDEQDCARIVVTAIPVFPTLVAAGLASGLGLLGYVALRRRR